MSTITFDTLELVDKLKAAGIEQKQAETIIRVIADAQSDSVTKEYLDSKLTPIYIDLAVIKTDMIFLKWSSGVVMVSILSLVIKSLF